MEQVVADDRISGLPEPLLHHILSFLLTEDAIKIAPTCKRLNLVWNTLPYLDLGDNFFPILPEDDNRNIGDGELTTDIVMRRREKLFTFVEQSLLRMRMQDLTVHKFRLRWTKLDIELVENLDRWIDYLVHCNINELVLGGIGWDIEDNRYKLPPVLLTATSLRTLKLSRCSMSFASVALSALQKLILEYIALHEKILLDIINTCPHLKYLKLWQCSGLRKRISLAPPRHSQLVTLMLAPSFDDEVDEVVIEAHNLEKLSYVGTFRPITINIITNSMASLKLLHLCEADITHAWFCELISRLSCLEELGLSQLNLKAIEISSSSLKRLILSRVFNNADNRFGEFKIDTPNLVSLVYVGSLSSVFQNSLVVKEVRFILDEFNRSKKTEHLCRDLMQFLQHFDYSEVVTLKCTYFESMIFPPAKKLKLDAPLAHIKHLVLEGVFRTSPTDVLYKLLHGVRRIAPNLDSLSLKSNIYGGANCLVKFTAGLTKSELNGKETRVGALRFYLNREPWFHKEQGSLKL